MDLGLVVAIIPGSALQDLEEKLQAIGVRGITVSRVKGAGRPILDGNARAQLVAALRCVDYVVLFSEATVEVLLEELRPDVHAKGTDYTADSVPERDAVIECGGRVEIVGDPKDHSASEIIRTRLGPRRA